MTSAIAICNIALANIGKARIDSLDEGTPEARACKLFYETVRDTILQSYPWRCAGKTISLAEVTNDKAGKWRYAYAKPVDCLRVLWVCPEYSELDECPPTDQQEMSIPFEVEGDVIYCDLSPAFLRYTSRLADPTRFPPLLADAMGWHMSARLAMPLTKDPKIRADCLTIARDVESTAQTADANGVRETSDHASEMVEVRG